MTKTILSTLFLAAALTGGAEPVQLSLADARQAAWQRNWDLLAARSGVDLATAQLLMVEEFPNPTLSASSARIGQHNNVTVEGNGLWSRSYDTIFAVNQLVEIGGKRGARQAAARAGVLGAKARFLDARRTLDQGVTKAYIAALLAGENERVLHESAGYMQHEADIAVTRFQAGDLAESDLNQIQVAARQYLLQENAATAAAIQARIAVEVLLGEPSPHGDWVPANSLDDLCTNLAPSVTAKSSALRPDVLAAQTDLRAAEASLRLAKAGRIPDPTFSVQYEHNPPDGNPPEDTIGLGLSFPLPVWNQNRGAIDSAKETVTQSRLALAKLQAQMTGDLATAEAASHEASERLQRYRDEIRPRSRSARESVIFKFEKGGAALVDLLEAQRSDNDVRLATAQAMADTASTAADLAAARTAITESDLAAVK